jgi:RNA polymerase sigma factor (TIGR02999 family)
VAETTSEITGLLARVRVGDDEALSRVYELLYSELKRLAAGVLASMPRGGTLTPTVLVHEAFLRLRCCQGIDLVDRRHLLACAARAMRQVLVDHVRAACTAKRGGGEAPLPLTRELGARSAPTLDLLAVHRALEALEEVNPRLRELVELRFFLGLPDEELAALNGVCTRTIRRDWERARAFLYIQIGA